MNELILRRWYWVTGFAGVMVVALLIWQFFLSGPAVPTLDYDKGRVIAKEFLEELRTERVVEAWEKTHTEFKSYRGKEAFVRMVKSKPQLKSQTHFDEDAQLKNSNVTVRYYIFRSYPEKSKIIVSIAPEGDAWRVANFVVE